MQKAHLWYQLHLYWRKIAVGLILMVLVVPTLSQSYVEINNPNYDNRKFSYGFLIGLHNTGYQLKYSERFISNQMDTLHSILTDKSPGFSLGFLVNYRVQEFFDVRITPKVAFYEHTLQYNFTDASEITKLKESTIVEFPVVAKYKSNRRANSRMYVVGGLKPGIEASGRSDLDSSVESLNIKRFNLSAEFGVGFDLYFPLFKFSPELRLSKGLRNIVSPEPSIYSEGISRLNTNTIHLYFLFQ